MTPAVVLARVVGVLAVVVLLVGCYVVPAPLTEPGTVPPPPPVVQASPGCWWSYGIGWYGWGWYGWCP